MRRRGASPHDLEPRHTHPGSPPRGGGSPTRVGGGASALPSQPLHTGELPQAKVTPPKDATLSRFHNYSIRVAMSFLMIFAFVLYAWSTRQVGVVVLIFALQAVIYTELVHVHISEARERSMTGFSSLYFYWFGVAAFFFYSRIILPYVSSALTGEPVPRGGRGGGGLSSLNPASVPPRLEGTKWRALAFWVTRWLVEKHVPISFALYCVGLVLFVVSLRRRRNFRYQFSQFAYCHIALLVVVGQSTLLVANAFSGLLWVLLPTGMVIANDCFAYLAGVFFGRTPLIHLSPKKTVEGFLGGAVATLAFSLLFTWWAQTVEVLGWKYLMVCPVQRGLGLSIDRCDIGSLGGGIFIPLPVGSHAGVVGWLARSVLSEGLASSVRLSPAQVHACVMGLFASFIAPFGGFLASGFKRAFKIKDFSSVIPGHGGFTDRFDCQLLMGAFAYVYAQNFLTLDKEGSGAVGHYFNSITKALRKEDIEALVSKLVAFLDNP